MDGVLVEIPRLPFESKSTQESMFQRASTCTVSMRGLHLSRS